MLVIVSSMFCFLFSAVVGARHALSHLILKTIMRGSVIPILQEVKLTMES